MCKDNDRNMMTNPLNKGKKGSLSQQNLVKVDSINQKENSNSENLTLIESFNSDFEEGKDPTDSPGRQMMQQAKKNGPFKPINQTYNNVKSLSKEKINSISSKQLGDRPNNIIKKLEFMPNDNPMNEYNHNYVSRQSSREEYVNLNEKFESARKKERNQDRHCEHHEQIEGQKKNKNLYESKKAKTDRFETQEIPLNKVSYGQTVRDLKTNASMGMFNDRRNQEKNARNTANAEKVKSANITSRSSRENLKNYTTTDIFDDENIEETHFDNIVRNKSALMIVNESETLNIKEKLKRNSVHKEPHNNHNQMQSSKSSNYLPKKFSKSYYQEIKNPNYQKIQAHVDNLKKIKENSFMSKGAISYSNIGDNDNSNHDKKSKNDKRSKLNNSNIERTFESYDNKEINSELLNKSNFSNNS